MQQLVEMSASVKLSAQMHVSLNEAKAGNQTIQLNNRTTLFSQRKS